MKNYIFLLSIFFIPEFAVVDKIDRLEINRVLAQNFGFSQYIFWDESEKNPMIDYRLAHDNVVMYSDLHIDKYGGGYLRFLDCESKTLRLIFFKSHIETFTPYDKVTDYINLEHSNPHLRMNGLTDPESKSNIDLDYECTTP